MVPGRPSEAGGDGAGAGRVESPDRRRPGGGSSVPSRGPHPQRLPVDREPSQPLSPGPPVRESGSDRPVQGVRADSGEHAPDRGSRGPGPFRDQWVDGRAEPFEQGSRSGEDRAGRPCQERHERVPYSPRIPRIRDLRAAFQQIREIAFALRPDGAGGVSVGASPGRPVGFRCALRDARRMDRLASPAPSRR